MVRRGRVPVTPERSAYLGSLWRQECTGASCPYCNEVDRPDMSNWKRTPAIRRTTPRAAYPHTCDDCGQRIAKGERYQREDGVAQGATWHVCRCLDDTACRARLDAQDAKRAADFAEWAAARTDSEEDLPW